jgi:hypothetical protein
MVLMFHTLQDSLSLHAINVIPNDPDEERLIGQKELF